ncbi:MAG: peptidyl-prolyl cis-trans isomerase [Gammaproteobacteria bacterium]|nr:peptidyl-prolyl cis-trans isomerase [Gammaproteobacteria bacterium]
MQRISALVLLLAAPIFCSGEEEVSSNPVVVMEITDGKIVLELNSAEAPVTVENFLKYVDAGFYNGTIFHRVIPNFVAQGGGYSPDFEEKETGDPIENESTNGLSNLRGTIAMARTGDPHSATAQFYINLVDNTRLDYREETQSWGYTVFGTVIEGMAVVDSIAEIPRGPGGPFAQDVPFRPVIINKAYRMTEETESEKRSAEE